MEQEQGSMDIKTHISSHRARPRHLEIVLDSLQMGRETFVASDGSSLDMQPVARSIVLQALRILAHLLTSDLK